MMDSSIPYNAITIPKLDEYNPVAKYQGIKYGFCIPAVIII